MSSESSSKSDKKNLVKILLSIVVVVVAAFFGIDVLNPSSQKDAQPTQRSSQQASKQTSQESSKEPSAWSTGSGSIAESQKDLVALAKSKRSGQMVELSARVVKVLNDDNDGARHQRFILAIDYTPSPADTLLVAHNIDLAPRVPLEKGDTVLIYGQYEWNDRGGVLHWTHHDPGGRHADGWIEHEGTRYD